MTGLRRGELLGLRWQDVDLDAGTLSVRQTVQISRTAGIQFEEPKTEKSRRQVTLPVVLVEALRRHRVAQAKERLVAGPDYQDHGLVFPRVDETHATLLLGAGIHPKVVSERLGHSTVNLTLDTYSHVLPGIQEEVAQKVDNLLRKTLRE